MWRKQAVREKAEDQHDCTREPQEAAIPENTCLGQVAQRGNTTYEALTLTVGATFILIHCHSCLTVALDQQQITSLVFKCWDVQDTLSVRYNTVFIINLKQFTPFRMSLPAFLEWEMEKNYPKVDFFFFHSSYVGRNVKNAIFYPVILALLLSDCSGESPVRFVSPSESSFPSKVERSISSPLKWGIKPQRGLLAHTRAVKTISLRLINRLRMISEKIWTQSHNFNSVWPTSMFLLYPIPLQEALELFRPDFISRSQGRVRKMEQRAMKCRALRGAEPDSLRYLEKTCKQRRNCTTPDPLSGRLNKRV